MTIRRLKFSPFFLWVSKGSFAILDQGLFAGANFLMNILLTRWLSPRQYGAFAFSFSLFLLLGAFHTAVLTEPMLVFGSGKYSKHFRKYLGMLIYGHIVLMIPTGLVLLAVALVLGKYYLPEVGGGLIGLAAIAPGILFFWLIRRALYVRLQPGRAVLGTASYFALLMGVIYSLYSSQRLSPATAFLGMGMCSVLVSLGFIVYLRPQWTFAGSPTHAMVIKEHWRYGRWAVGTAALIWLPGNIYFVVLPSWIGLEGIAALRALLNLVLPLLHIITALSVLLLPLLTRYFRQDVTRFANTMKLFLGLLLTVSGLYLLCLYSFGTEVLRLLYGGKYAEYSSLVLVVGLLPFASSLIAVLGSALRAMERPRMVFYCYAVSGIVSIVVGVNMARALGMQGALLGVLLSYLATGIMMFAFSFNMYRRWHRKSRSVDSVEFGISG